MFHWTVKTEGGKEEVTLVEGFIGSEIDIKDLSKMLKNKFGVGGSVKKTDILIQGNFVKRQFQYSWNWVTELNKKVGLNQ